MTVCNSQLCLVLSKANPQNCTNQCSKPVKLIWWLLLTLFNSSVNVRSKADSVPHWAHCANEFSPLCSTLLCCTRVGSTLVTLICWMCPLCVPLSPTRLFSGHTLLHTVGEHSKEGHCDSAVCYMPKVKCSCIYLEEMTVGPNMRGQDICKQWAAIRMDSLIYGYLRVAQFLF